MMQRTVSDTDQRRINLQIDFRPSDEKRVSRYKSCGSLLYRTDMPMESVWNPHLQRWIIDVSYAISL
jgi:hypothetical protein